MDQERTDKLMAIWQQRNIPVLLNRGKNKRLRMRFPEGHDHHSILHVSRKHRPLWIEDKKYWDVARIRLNEIVKHTLATYGKLYVVQPYRVQERCAPACWDAEGHDCQCQCMGEHHGSRSNGQGWFIVSDVFASRYQDQELACRLLTADRDKPGFETWVIGP